MNRLCTDADLMNWEPLLFEGCGFVGQRLAYGNDGVTQGRSFASTSSHFVDSGVQAGHVLKLLNEDSSDLDSYVVKAVDGQVLLTIGELYDDQDALQLPIRKWPFSIDTFDALIAETEIELRTRFGSEYIDSLEGSKAKFAKRACTFGTLVMVFRKAAECRLRQDMHVTWRAKAALYLGLYEKEQKKLLT